MTQRSEGMREVRAHYEGSSPAHSRRRDSGLAGLIRRREQESVLELLDLGAGERLLDVGCGDGAVSARAAAAGAVPLAADLALSMAAAARRRGIAAIAADASALPLRSGFDAVAWVGSSEFVEDLLPAAREVARCLEAPGRLVLLFPRRNWFGLLLLVYHRRHGIRIRLRSRREVTRTLSAAGFAPEEERRRRAGAWVCRFRLAREPDSR